MFIRWHKIVILLVAVLFLVSCSNEPKEGQSTYKVNAPSIEEMNENTIETLFYKLDIDSFHYGLRAKNNKIYVIEEIENTNQNVRNYNYKIFDIDGTLLVETPLQLDKAYKINQLQISEDEAFILLVKDVLSKDNQNQYSYLLFFNRLGEMVRSEKISDLFEGTELHFSDLQIDKHGYIYLLEIVNQNILVFNNTGDFVCRLDVKKEEVTNLCSNKDGGIDAYRKDGEKVVLWGIDIENKTLIDKNKIMLVTDDSFLIEKGKSKDYLICNNNSLLDFDMKEKKYIEIVNWVRVGINPQEIKNISIMSEDTIVVIVQKMNVNRDIEIVLINKVAEQFQKEEITLVTFQPSSELKSQVVNFNKQSEKYSITIKSYMDSIKVENTKEDELHRLNADLIEGVAGDILDLESLCQYTSRHYYVNKGLLENIYPWMAQDMEINESDYLQNIFTANEIGGNLYNFVPLFTIRTMLGRVSEVGEKTHWTIDEMLENLDDKMLIANTDKYEMVRYICRFHLDNYIDWEKGIADFETEEFVKMLEIANALPEESEIGVDDLDLLHDGKAILYECPEFGRTLIDYQIAHAVFGQAITMVGFPNDKSAGSLFNNVISLGMLASSDKKEGVWEFFKSFCTEEYQKNLQMTAAFPILLEQLKEKSWINNPNNGGIYSVGNSISGWEAVLEVPSEEELNKIYEWMNSITRIDEVDYLIQDIILEEATRYFKGDCTPQYASKMINKRVSLYLKEQYK